MEKIRKCLRTLGRGTGQVMFQGNALSGALMGVGILCGSLPMALLALTGNVAGTGFAMLMKYDRDEVAAGLYGFNATLVGLAVAVFLPLTAVSVLLLLAGSCLSVWLTRLLAVQRVLPGLTAPFVLVTWLLQAIGRWCLPALPPTADAVADCRGIDWLSCFFLSFGQVMFQGGTIVPGILFLLAILLNSRRQALYASAGAALSVAVALGWGEEPEAINAGLMGYNGVLCALALADGTWSGGIRAAIAVVLSVALQLGGMYAGIPVLTAPFVLAVWVVTGFRVWMERRAVG